MNPLRALYVRWFPQRVPSDPSAPLPRQRPSLGPLELLRIQLRTERVGILGWGIGLFLLTWGVAASFIAIEDSGLDEVMEAFEGLGDALGVDSFTSPDGYLKSQSIILYPLLLGIYGGLAAAKAFAGAQETGRLDHILARPISRMRYFLTNAASLALGQTIIVLLIALGAVLGYAGIDRPASDVRGAFLMSLEVLPIALTHLSIGLLAGVIADRRGQAVGIVMAAVVGGFSVDLMGKLVEDLDWLEYATPYGWWSRSDWYNDHVDGLYLVGSLLLTAACTAAAALRFDNKDL